MSEEQITQWMGSVDMDYITEDAPEGNYRISAEINGNMIVEETQIMKDHWFK